MEPFQGSEDVNKNFAVATIAGTIIMFVLGYALYGIALMGFFESNVGSAVGVAKEVPDFPWLILGNVVTAAFLGILLGWKGANDVGSGAKVGATVGFLVSLGYGLVMYSTTNISNLTATLVDPFVSAVMFGATGAVMGMLLGKNAA